MFLTSKKFNKFVVIPDPVAESKTVKRGVQERSPEIESSEISNSLSRVVEYGWFAGGEDTKICQEH